MSKFPDAAALPGNAGSNTKRLFLAYNLLWACAGIPVVSGLLLSRIVSRKRRKTVLQRLGWANFPDSGKDKSVLTGKKPIWVHALSVGEALSAVPLARALKQEAPERTVVFSSSTLTGFETASRLLGSERIAVFYFPYDLLFSVRAVIDRIDPALAVIVETDIWPNFLWEMKRRGTPVLLVNARLSDRSYTGYRRFLKWTAPVFGCFSHVCAQSRNDAKRFMELGLSAEKVTVAGNLKYDAPPDAGSETTLAFLKQRLSPLSHRPCLIAGSTHPGEEAVVLDAFARLKAALPDLYLILAPRDRERGHEVLRLAASRGWQAELLTETKKCSGPCLPDIIVVDTIGHLKSLYAFSSVAFVGGSLLDFGGHNPLEPAAFAKPVLFGPHFRDVAESGTRLLEAGAARVVHDASELFLAAQKLLACPEDAQAMGRKAYDVLEENRGALTKTLDAVRRFA